MQVEWLFGGYNVSMGESHINPPPPPPPPTPPPPHAFVGKKNQQVFFVGGAMKASGHVQENKKELENAWCCDNARLWSRLSRIAGFPLQLPQPFDDH